MHRDGLQALRHKVEEGDVILITKLVYGMWEKRVKEKGSMVNIKRVKRLCRLIGLNAIGIKSNTSKLAL